MGRKIKLRDLTPGQWEVMRLLEDGPKATSKHTGHPYVSGNTAESLIRLGLVERQPGKSHVVQLTEQGKLCLERGGHGLKAW